MSRAFSGWDWFGYSITMLYLLVVARRQTVRNRRRTWWRGDDR